MLLSFPIGKAWARYMPNVSIFGISLNPGPFTIKEHVIVTVIATTNPYPDAVGTESGKLCRAVTLTPLLD
jgi:OPT oligopeptide transporter protein